MSIHLFVMPVTDEVVRSAITDPDWWGDVLEAVAPTGRAPDAPELKAILEGLRIGFDEQVEATPGGASWIAMSPGGSAHCPFSELALGDGSVSIRGPGTEALEIARQVAVRRGPQFAVCDAYGLPVLVDTDLDPADLAAAVFGGEE